MGRKRNISLLVAHWLYGSEKFRFFYNTTIVATYICVIVWEWKRNISLLVAHWLYGSEKFRFLLYPLVTTSEMFRFLGHNIRTHESLRKSQYIRRNLFAYYANCRLPCLLILLSVICNSNKDSFTSMNIYYIIFPKHTRLIDRKSTCFSRTWQIDSYITPRLYFSTWAYALLV